MTDTVAFVGVEEEYLVRLGDRIISSEMSNEDARDTGTPCAWRSWIPHRSEACSGLRNGHP